MPNELATRLPGEIEADEALIAATIAEINTAWTTGQVTSASQVGELVVNAFFGGDAANARLRGKRHVSFKALAEHESLKMSATTLWYCVKMFEQLPLLGEAVASQLTMAHHKLLLHVADIDLRRRLASEAAAAGQTVPQLTTAIGNTRTAPADGDAARAGRPALPAAVKNMNLVKKSITPLNAITPATLGALDAAKRQETLDEARAFAAQVATWWQAIEAAQPAAEASVSFP